VYNIVLHEGHWRIEFDGLFIGQFPTAEAAAEAALKIAQSRVAPSAGTRITVAPNGDLSVCDPGEGEHI
jgi:hypothetical protein